MGLLPGAFVVKEEDKEELLSSLCLLLLAQLQHVQWRDRDGDAIVQEALPGHLGIDDLEAEKETGSEQGRMESHRTSHQGTENLSTKGSGLQITGDGGAGMSCSVPFPSPLFYSLHRLSGTEQANPLLTVSIREELQAAAMLVSLHHLCNSPPAPRVLPHWAPRL